VAQAGAAGPRGPNERGSGRRFSQEPPHEQLEAVAADIVEKPEGEVISSRLRPAALFDLRGDIREQPLANKPFAPTMGSGRSG
jgi:hypothetical protein